MNILNSRGVLVELHVSIWSSSKHDKTVSEEVSTNKGAMARSARVTKKLVRSHWYDQMAKAAREIRKVSATITTGFGETGMRYLPSELIVKYSDTISQLIDDYHKQVKLFVQYYPQVRHAASTQLGNLYNPLDYPDEDEILNGCYAKFVLRPIPDGSHFVFDVADEIIEKAKQDLDEHMHLTMKGISAEALGRLGKVIDNMVEQLQKFDPTSKTKSFHNTLTTNIVEVVEVMKHLNFENDPEFEAMIKQAESLSWHNAKELKANTEVRQAVLEDAKRVQEAIKAKAMEGAL